MAMPIHSRRFFHLAPLLLCLCLPIRSAAEEKWIEVRSTHFTVQTPGSEKDGRKIADQFEQIRALFHSAFPTLRTDPAQPIVVIGTAYGRGTVVVEGELADVDCSKVPEITLDMVKDGEETVYHIADAKVLDVSMQDKSPAPTCKQWTGKKVKLWTAPSSDPADVAEITRILFE